MEVYSCSASSRIEASSGGVLSMIEATSYDMILGIGNPPMVNILGMIKSPDVYD